jgi:hypothetical protein
VPAAGQRWHGGAEGVAASTYSGGADDRTRVGRAANPCSGGGGCGGVGEFGLRPAMAKRIELAPI